jgi:glycosyltransferase involved in cell wall biosynthesis
MSPSRTALAIVNRVMASLVASAAERAFVSIPAWRSSIAALVRSGTPVEWLPVPSAIPMAADSVRSAEIRVRVAGRRPIVGHFGAHGRLVTALLTELIPALAARTDCRVLFIGRGGTESCRELIDRHPALAGRVHATGPLTNEDVSHHLAACDVMVQPYPDGISTRRTSAMAALSHGIPLVTTAGWLTEPLWESSNAVVLAPVGRPVDLAAAVAGVLDSTHERARLAGAGRALYEERFALSHTIRALREQAPSTVRDGLRHAS